MFIKGSTGDYAEDRKTWIVGVFLTEAKANAWKDKCTTWASRRISEYTRDFGGCDYLAEGGPFDPFFFCMDGQTRYSVEPAPFLETSDEVNMGTRWHLANASIETKPIVVMSGEQQAQARQAFLSGLPKGQVARK